MYFQYKYYCKYQDFDYLHEFALSGDASPASLYYETAFFNDSIP